MSCLPDRWRLCSIFSESDIWLSHSRVLMGKRQKSPCHWPNHHHLWSSGWQSAGYLLSTSNRPGTLSHLSRSSLCTQLVLPILQTKTNKETKLVLDNLTEKQQRVGLTSIKRGYISNYPGIQRERLLKQRDWHK